jgi:hypothetical protein
MPKLDADLFAFSVQVVSSEGQRSAAASSRRARIGTRPITDRVRRRAIAIKNRFHNFGLGGRIKGFPASYTRRMVMRPVSTDVGNLRYDHVGTVEALNSL